MCFKVLIPGFVYRGRARMCLNSATMARRNSTDLPNSRQLPDIPSAWQPKTTWGSGVYPLKCVPVLGSGPVGLMMIRFFHVSASLVLYFSL